MDSAFVFDFDGTIVNSMPLLADAAVNLVCRRYGVGEEQAEKWYWNTVGVPFAEQLSILGRSGFGFDTNELVSATTEYFELASMVYEVVEPFPETIEAFEMLDYNCHIISGTNVSLVTQYAKKWFPHAQQCIETKAKFPALQCIALAHRATFFGDVSKDAEMARIAGAKFVAIERFLGTAAQQPWPTGTRVANNLINGIKYALKINA